MSAVGLNFTMNMTWEGLIRLCLGKKRPKNNFQIQGTPITYDPVCALWLEQPSESVFLGHPAHTSYTRNTSSR